jgi:transposase
MTVELLTFVDWLLVYGCIYVATESRGDDWKPVFNILSGTCEVLLVDAQYGQAVSWCKTNKHRINESFRRSLPW